MYLNNFDLSKSDHILKKHENSLQWFANYIYKLLIA